MCSSFASFDEGFLISLCLNDYFFVIPCGETGIRTPETLLEFTRFPGVPLQPLEHLSYAHLCACFTNRLQRYYIFRKYARVCERFLQFFVILCRKGLSRCDLWFQLSVLQNSYRPAQVVRLRRSSADSHCVHRGEV